MSFREGLKPGQPFVISKDELSKFSVLSAKEMAELREQDEEKLKNTEIKTSPEHAAEIMGADFLGAEAVENTFGITLEQEQIPEIPFSEAELERARELGQFLVLRADTAPDGQSLTMKKMNELLADKFKKAKKGKILYDTDWYKNEDFFVSETPKLGWALVSKENIPNSTSKNYLQQTQELAKYLTNEVFKDKTVSQEYEDAISEFEDYYQQNFAGKNNDQIRELLGGDNWQKYAQELADLKINQLTRQSPTEALYDILMYFGKNSRILENKYTWTKRRSSYGGLVGVGKFDAGGADVSYWRPGLSYVDLGVSFSRSP